MEFDAEEHADDSRDVVEAGMYTLRVADTRIDQTKSGSGELLKIGFEILGPRFSGRWVWDQFIVRHTSSEALRIGLGRLSECSRALRTAKWRNERELIGQTCDARIVVIDDPTYGPKNEIKRYQVPAAYKGSAAANPHRDDLDRRGGALRDVMSRQPPTRPEPPPLGDDDIPF